MPLYAHSLFQIYFGDAQDQLFPNDYAHLTADMLVVPPFSRLKKLMNLEKLVFLRQVHGAKGMIISADTALVRPFSRKGDFLVTDQKHVGLGVLTADCLPIILGDFVTHCIALVHAGWKGSLQRVTIRAVEHMQQKFGTKVEDVQVFFGPSVKPCCYQVDKHFLDYLKDFDYTDQVVRTQGENIFFDLPGFNRLQLETLGIKKESFHFDNNICTLCNKNFFSYRRQGETSGRQMTVVSLKEKADSLRI